MNMKPLEGDWAKQTAMEAAQNRVMDTLERGRTPKRKDLEVGRLCPSCWGHGYYREDEDDEAQTTCKSCDGTGLAANHPNRTR